MSPLTRENAGRALGRIGIDLRATTFLTVYYYRGEAPLIIFFVRRCFNNNSNNNASGGVFRQKLFIIFNRAFNYRRRSITDFLVVTAKIAIIRRSKSIWRVRMRIDILSSFRRGARCRGRR